MTADDAAGIASAKKSAKGAPAKGAAAPPAKIKGAPKRSRDGGTRDSEREDIVDSINVLNKQLEELDRAAAAEAAAEETGPKGGPVGEVCSRTIQLLASMGGIWEEGMPRTLQEAAWPDRAMNMGPDTERLRRSALQRQAKPRQPKSRPRQSGAAPSGAARMPPKEAAAAVRLKKKERAADLLFEVLRASPWWRWHLASPTLPRCCGPGCGGG